MSKEEDNKAVVGRWFTDFWGKTCNLGVVDEIASPNMLLKHSLHEPRAHSSDRERSIRSIMNTDSGDHERLPGSAGGGPDERHGVMAGYCHRQLSPLILSGVSSSLQSRP